MAIDPVTGSLILGLGGKFLGGLFGGDGGKKDDQRLQRDRFGLEKEAFGFDKSQTLRKNSIEDTEIGHKRQNVNALSPYVLMLLQSIMGKTGAGQGPQMRPPMSPPSPNMIPGRRSPGVFSGKYMNPAMFGGQSI